MSLAAYVAEDGLIWPSLGGEALGLAKIIYPFTGESQGQEAGVLGWGIGREEDIGDFWNSI